MAPLFTFEVGVLARRAVAPRSMNPRWRVRFIALLAGWPGPSAAAAGLECWNEGLGVTWETCCRDDFGPTGNRLCWDDVRFRDRVIFDRATIRLLHTNVPHDNLKVRTCIRSIFRRNNRMSRSC